MRVLICGSRDWEDGDRIREELEKLKDVEVVIEGGARGADFLGSLAAHKLNIPVLEFPANWDKYGRSAGSVRNTQMLVEGKPDLVLAFQIGNSPGTNNMIRQTKEAGIQIKIFKE